MRKNQVDQICADASFGDAVRDIVSVDYMRPLSVAGVYILDSLSFREGWSVPFFHRYLADLRRFGVVAKFGDLVVGFAMCELRDDCIYIWRIAVSSEFRRFGIGRSLLVFVERKWTGKRAFLSVDVHDANLEAQLFFRSCGFLATFVSRGIADDGGDFYRMEKRRDFVTNDVF